MTKNHQKALVVHTLFQGSAKFPMYTWHPVPGLLLFNDRPDTIFRQSFDL